MSLWRELFVVNAFAAHPFGGNPAAVIELDAWPADAILQTVAAQMNLSETAFVVPQAQGHWELRWFTPLREVPFCGHATLASAHVLIAHRGSAGPVTFDTQVGRIDVSRSAAGYTLDLPRHDPEPTEVPADFAASLPATPRGAFRNFENLFLVFDDPAAVRQARPDLAAARALSFGGVALTAPGTPSEGADFISRYFAPAGGIDEDPVTGSTHATLAPYWADRLGKAQLRAYQASARGGWLDCLVGPARVSVGGAAATVLEGRLRWPDG